MNYQNADHKNCLLLILWRFHFIFVSFYLGWSYLNAPFDVWNSQFIDLRFSVHRFHSQKQRNDQRHGNKGQNWRTFVKNVATFGGRFLVFVHDGFQLTNSCSMKLDCHANCLISLQQFYAPVYGTCRDITVNTGKPLLVDLSSFGENFNLLLASMAQSRLFFSTRHYISFSLTGKGLYYQNIIGIIS